MVLKPSPNHIFWRIRATALSKDMKVNKIKTRLYILLVKIHKPFLATLLFMWSIIYLALQGQILP